LSNVVRPHIPEEELHAYSDGELSPPQRVEIAEHLLGCLICRAQHAEVTELRARTARLLAIAAPRTVRGPAMPAFSDASRRRRLPRITAAAVAAVVGAGVWFSLQPDRIADQGTPSQQLASSLPAADFLLPGHASSDRAASWQRQVTIASRTTVPARVLPPAVVSTQPRPHLVSTTADVDPVVANEWNNASWDDALSAGDGSLARVAGLAVTEVRMHPSTSGGRPTFMVRQQLADGNLVWVFEGPVDDVTPVNQMLQASGIAMSTPSRTHPDYVFGANGGVTRPSRMVTVVGHLSVDSLNALSGRVKLQ
jgi:anti-sigma factor RsiW